MVKFYIEKLLESELSVARLFENAAANLTKKGGGTPVFVGFGVVSDHDKHGVSGMMIAPGAQPDMARLCGLALADYIGNGGMPNQDYLMFQCFVHDSNGVSGADNTKLEEVDPKQYIEDMGG